MKIIATVLASIGFGMFALQILDALNIFQNNIVPFTIFGYAWFLIAGALIIIGVILGNIFGKHYNYYCAKCDQYLGKYPPSSNGCPRCGSNRFNKEEV